MALLAQTALDLNHNAWRPAMPAHAPIDRAARRWLGLVNSAFSSGTAAMAQNPYDTDLDRNPPNFQPLTPLAFLQRCAEVFPDRTAVIHGARRTPYRDFYARARRLASALAGRGISRGDTVAVMLANTPAMLEAHY